MKFIGTLFLAFIASTFAASCNFACSNTIAPVCGTDRKTYFNVCALREAACKQNKVIKVARNGVCLAPAECAATTCVNPLDVCVFQPKQCITTPCPQVGCMSPSEAACNRVVCPGDKQCTYTPRKCSPNTICPQFSCVKPTPTEPPCAQFCPQVYQPVCGSDGKTYSNACTLGREACLNPEKNLQQISSGACPCDEAVCAANEVCVNEPKQCITTPCPQYSCKRQCTEFCIQIFDPVCGSDGKTYSNACTLGREACLNPEKNLQQISSGACPCDDVVCPSGQTCVNEPKQCFTTPCPQYSCKTPCADFCIQVYQPVCGSDGVTYSNSCFLGKAACENPEKNLQQVSEGPCGGSASI